MDLRQLRTFLIVAETGNLSRASERLHVVQPALSRQIRMLEAELGTPLFARLPRGMSLTEAGEVLVEHARSALRELAWAKSELAALDGQLIGRVGLGMLPSVSDLMTGRVASAMRERHPHVRLDFVTSDASHLFDWLEKREIDLAIVSEPLVPFDLDFRPLLEEPLYLVGPTPHAFPRDKVPLCDLAQYPLILPKAGLGLRAWIDRMVHAAGVELEIVAEANSVHVLCSLVRAHIGYAIVPSSVVFGCQAAKGFSAARIVDPPMFRRVGVAMPLTRQRPLVARSASELIVEEIQKSFEANDWPEARLLS